MKTAKLIAIGATALASIFEVSGIDIKMLQTTENRPLREIKNTVPFSSHCAIAVPSIDLDNAKESHEFTGLGVSFAEASCTYLDVSVQAVPLIQLFYSLYDTLKVGFPIRKSPDHSSFAAPRSLSQLITSFIGS